MRANKASFTEIPKEACDDKQTNRREKALGEKHPGAVATYMHMHTLERERKRKRKEQGIIFVPLFLTSFFLIYF